MTAFADTNWLEALYFASASSDRHAIVQRWIRKHGGPLLISHIVLLEARNVFDRTAGRPRPPQWERLEGDFDGRIFVDPMNWAAQRDGTHALFDKYSHKTTVGTFDAALVASALLCGARSFLSFDRRAKALAAAEGLEVFPELDAPGRSLLAELRR